MDLFKGKNLIEFAERFDSEESCIEYLAHIKWKNGFMCVKRGHTASQIRRNHSRTCNKCSHAESATSNTLFHKVKFGVRKAFLYVLRYNHDQKPFGQLCRGTFWGYRKNSTPVHAQNQGGMKSSGNHPMDVHVLVDEFVIGGKEEGKVGLSYNSRKKKVVCAVQLTDEGKVKRMYSMKIDNYSSKELRKLFVRHISGQAIRSINVD